MKRIVMLISVLSLLFAVFPAAGQAEPGAAGEADQAAAEAYIIGTEADTFAGLYEKMCADLDLKKEPVPEPEKTAGRGAYGREGEYESVTVLKDDDETFETIGYVCLPSGEREYIVRRWIGYHEDGSIIGMEVYYLLNGQYLGSIRRDYEAGRASSSSRCPYLVAGDPVSKP